MSNAQNTSSAIASVGNKGSARPLRQHQVVLTLNEEGFIQEIIDTCKIAIKNILTVHAHISSLLPKLEGIKLISRDAINPKLNYLSHIGHLFVIRLSEHQFIFGTLFFHCYKEDNQYRIRVTIFPELESTAA